MKNAKSMFMTVAVAAVFLLHLSAQAEPGKGRPFQDLQDQIDQVAQDQAAGDQGLQDQIDQEVQDRAAGDQGLQDQIDQEVQDRAASDQGLQDQIDQEVQDRTDGDQNLQDQIDQEVQDRTDGDQNLQDQIDELQVQQLAGLEWVKGRVFFPGVMDPDDRITKSVSCPSGKVIIGGGYEMAEFNPVGSGAPAIIEAAPIHVEGDDDYFELTMWNDKSQWVEVVDLYIYAICIECSSCTP